MKQAKQIHLHLQSPKLFNQNENNQILPNTKTIHLYNTMMKSYDPHFTLSLYTSLQKSGLRPDSYSFPPALSAATRLSSLRTGLQIHSQSIRFGFHSSLHVATALIQVYSCFPPSISDARKVFDEITVPNRDATIWNAMLAAYARVGKLDCAMLVFETMPDTMINVVSWTTLISGYARIDRPREAIALFRKMQLRNVQPDEIAMLSALSACARLGALQLGEWIHNYIDKHRFRRIVPLYNALIAMYAKSGNIEKALLVFRHMERKTVVTWTTMISGLALHGLGRDALDMFSLMEKAGVQPNHVTFVAVLSACAHVGLVDVGRFYFDSMSSRYGIEPKIEHYGCMIDLLGRSGQLLEARELLGKMPFPPNAAIWGSLLAASNTHGDAKLGEQALHQLMVLEPDNSGNYALLSNIYSSFGRWSDSGFVRKVMKDSGVKKAPGGSSIEVNNVVYEFIAGEKSHSQFDSICELLSLINQQLKLSNQLEKECYWKLEVGANL